MITLPKIIRPYNNYSPSGNKIKITNTMYKNFKNNSNRLVTDYTPNNLFFNRTFKFSFYNPLNEEKNTTLTPAEEKILKKIDFIHNPIMDKEIERLRDRQINDDLFKKAIKKLTSKKKDEIIKRGMIRRRTIYGINYQPDNVIKKEDFVLNKYFPYYDDNKILKRKKDKHYSKNIMGALNNKLFSGEINKPWISLDLDSYEKKFEEEVKTYQLSKIVELNNLMHDNDNIEIINNIEDLEKINFEQNIGYGKLFHIRENNFNAIEANKKLENSKLKLDLSTKEKHKDVNLFNKSKSVHHKKKAKQIYTLFDKKDIEKAKLQELNKEVDEDEEILNFELTIYYCQNLTVCNKNLEGVEGINQDSFIQLLSINGNKKFHLFGVMDGHGINGHIISKYVSRFISEYIISDKCKKIFKKCKTNEDIYKILTRKNYSFINKLISDCHNSLANNNNYECNISGSTCLLIFIIENNLICVNVGNSRAILLEKTELLQLSIDQTLNDPEEFNRVLSKGGKVKQINKKNNSKIVLENMNSNDFDISRSIGDKKLKNIGIIYEPVITEYKLSKKSRFIIMGTQGLWKGLSNEKAAIQVNKSIKLNNPLDSCRLLVKKAEKILKKSFSPIDDITVITIIFEEANIKDNFTYH